MNNKTLWLMINPTFQCNKNCSFCYIKGISTANSSQVIGIEEIDIIEAAYRRHLDRYGISKHNLLEFFGGEPLLAEDIIRLLVSRIRAITPEIFCGTFTNGSLLHEDFIKWTKDNRVGIYVSANDTPTYLLREYLLKVRQYRKYTRLSIVLSWENLQRLDELVDLALELDVHLRLRHQYDQVANPDYVAFYDQVIPPVIERIVSHGKTYPYFLYEMINPFWKHKMTHICGRNYFVIDPNLDVRVCLAQDHKIGNLHDPNFDFFEAIRQSSHERFGYEGNQICEQCEFRDICGGGCPLTKKLAFGRTDVPSPLCPTFKKVIPMLLRMAKHWEETGRAVRY